MRMCRFILSESIYITNISVIISISIIFLIINIFVICFIIIILGNIALYELGVASYEVQG